MHIHEGILPGLFLVSSYVFSFLGVAIGLKSMNINEITKVGMLAAVFFIVSFVHIPIGFSSAHLTVSGLIGILLGWGSFPLFIVILMIQAVMLHHGGVTTLGINTLILGIPAVFCHYLFKFIIMRRSSILVLTAFCCGFLSVFMMTVLVSITLIMAYDNFKEIVIFLFIAHIPVMIIEGLFTSTCVSIFVKIKPEIMPSYFSNIEFK